MPKAIKIDIYNKVKKELLEKLQPFCKKIKIPDGVNFCRSIKVFTEPKLGTIDGIFGKEMIIMPEFLETIDKYGKTMYNTGQSIHIVKFPEDILIKFKIEV